MYTTVNPMTQERSTLRQLSDALERYQLKLTILQVNRMKKDLQAAKQETGSRASKHAGIMQAAKQETI